MEGAAVNVATGAIGPVLEKLTALLVNEQYRSHLGSGTRGDIEFIKSKLASLHSLLLRIWEREDLGADCTKWMTEARELSYDMEDDIDDYFMLRVKNDGGPRRRLENLVRNLKTKVVDVAMRCRAEWRRASHDDEAISNNQKQGSKRSVDPRAGFHHKDASELVGMDEPKERLLWLLQDHTMVCIHGFAGTGKTVLANMVYTEMVRYFECQAFVSLSKSPDMLEVLEAILSQVTNKGVQSSDSRRSTQAATEENLINEISNFLSNKRYLVILDDIWHWHEWEIISRAFPEDAPWFRVLTTTRSNAIAEKCRLKFNNSGGACIYRHVGIDRHDAFPLSIKVLDKTKVLLGFERDVSDLLARKIEEMCCGMPLAVECLSSAVASSIEHDDPEWHYIVRDVESTSRRIAYRFLDAVERKLWQMLLDGLLSSSNNHPSLKPLAESLGLGYDDLPLHLKTCLLYCSIYPCWYKIERHGLVRKLWMVERLGLVRKWMAEGFIVYHGLSPLGRKAKAEAEAEAEGYLDELVSRGLLQPAKAESSEEKHKHYYSVHPMMRAFLVCKAQEYNLVTFYHGNDDSPSSSSQHAGRLCRRLSVDLPVERPGNVSSIMDVSHIRSLVVFCDPWSHAGPRLLVPWEQLDQLRVLSIESRWFPLFDTDLVDICSRLLRLRYLGIRRTPITVLPPQIGRLQNLETLDISDAIVREIPRYIGELHHLKTLDVSDTSVSEVPRDIGKLHHLVTLDVSRTSVRELPYWLFRRSGSTVVIRGGHKAVKFSADTVLPVMESWNMGTILSWLVEPPAREEDLSIVLCDHLHQPLPVPGLKVGRKHFRVPVWIKQHLAGVPSLDIRLCKLEEDDQHFLQNEMTSLQHLTLRLEVLPREPIVLTGAGFSMLKSFCLDCRLPLVAFQQGAMPKLEHLEFKFYTASRATTSKDPMGIGHLRSLERVVFQSSRYKSDAPGISVVINKVREEAKDHTNKITISINGKYEEVIREKKKAAVESASSSNICGGDIVTDNGGAGGSRTGASMLPIPCNVTDDEKAENIIPVKIELLPIWRH